MERLVLTKMMSVINILSCPILLGVEVCFCHFLGQYF
jgi:hypothetical protein